MKPAVNIVNNIEGSNSYKGQGESQLVPFFLEKYPKTEIRCSSAQNHTPLALSSRLRVRANCEGGGLISYIELAQLVLSFTFL